jgi:hypothetical protein
MTGRGSKRKNTWSGEEEKPLECEKSRRQSLERLRGWNN